MEVFDQTTECVITRNLKTATNLYSQFVGLMGKVKFEEGEGLWLPYCTGVHTCFLKFPIDVVFVDRDFFVVGIVQNLPPWRATNFFLKAHFALELPAGTVEKLKIKKGDRLVLKEG